MRGYENDVYMQYNRNVFIENDIVFDENVSVQSRPKRLNHSSFKEALYRNPDTSQQP